MKIVASADLGGLGNNESEGATCRVGRTLPIAESLPWLFLAGVLFIERRRQRHNGWILLGLVGGFLLSWGLGRVLTFVPAEVREMEQPVLQALLYGLTMACLLSSCLTSPKLRVTFLKVLGVLAVGSSLTLYGLIDIDDSRIAMASWMSLLIVGGGTAVGLVTGGMAYRRWPRTGTFITALIVGCFGSVCLVASVQMLASNGRPPWLMMLVVVAVLALVLALVLLPLILVLFQHPAQRARLVELLNLPSVEQSGSQQSQIPQATLS